MSFRSNFDIHHIRVWPVPQQVALTLLPALPIDLGAWRLILGCRPICGIGELLDLVLHLLVYWANLAQRIQHKKIYY